MAFLALLMYKPFGVRDDRSNGEATPRRGRVSPLSEFFRIPCGRVIVAVSGMECLSAVKLLSDWGAATTLSTNRGFLFGTSGDVLFDRSFVLNKVKR